MFFAALRTPSWIKSDKPQRAPKTKNSKTKNFPFLTTATVSGKICRECNVLALTLCCNRLRTTPAQPYAARFPPGSAKSPFTTDPMELFLPFSRPISSDAICSERIS